MRHHILALTTAAALFVSGCANIATFDRTAYEKATDAKAAALVAMSRATSSYESQQVIVTPLLLEADEAYEYDLGRAKNRITIQQWELLRNPEGNLLGGFVRRWQERGSLRPAYITEKKRDVAFAFDQIIALERGKRVVTTNPAP